MRIISGTARGRKLAEPKGDAVRPTSDMVKESIFNIIQFDIEGRDVLDLFAGTGQLGIEALSRGAGHCTFTDSAQASVSLIRKNLGTAGFEDRAELACVDGIGFLSRNTKYDIIFLDPPYDSDLLPKAMQKITEFDILKENGIIVAETRERTPVPEVSPPYFFRRSYRYGKTDVSIFRKEGQL
jgi:16S rRNA (guanine(966)-N(2))-methyltransferase RsmD